MRFSVLVLTVLSFAANPLAAQTRIRWHNNFQQAVKEAQRTNQLILLHFELDNCPPCRTVERNVFPRPQVAQTVHANFVPVKLNYKNAKKLAGQLNVNRFPSDVIITPNGKVLRRGISPLDPQKYSGMLKQIASQHYGPQDQQRSRLAGRNGSSNYVGDARYTRGAKSNNNRLVNNQRPVGQRDNYRNRNFDTRSSRRDSTGNARFTPQEDPNRRLANRDPSGRDSTYRSRGGIDQDPNRNDTNGRPRFENSNTGRLGGDGGQLGNNTNRLGSNRFGGHRADQFSNNQRQRQRNAGGQVPFDNSRSRAGQDQRLGQSSGNFRNTNSPPRAGNNFNNAPYADRSRNNRGGVNRQDNPRVDPRRNRLGQNGGFDGRGPRANNMGQTPNNNRRPKLVNNPYLDGGSAAASRGLNNRNRGGRTPVCFDGYCPVTLRSQKLWRKGSPSHSMTYGGRTYYFATPEARKAFAQQPARYSPVLSGFDPVVFVETGRRVFGLRRHGLFVGQSIYLFRDEATLRRFKSAPERYNNAIRQALAPRRNR